MSDGKKHMEQVLGEANTRELLKKIDAISQDYGHYVTDFAYGDLHSRKGLSDKERELAIVACLIGQRNTGAPLQVHLKGMLNVGWKPKEVKNF